MPLRLLSQDPAFPKKTKVSCSSFYQFYLTNAIAAQVVGGKRVDKKTRKTPLKSQASIHKVPTLKQHRDEKTCKAATSSTRHILYITNSDNEDENHNEQPTGQPTSDSEEREDDDKQEDDSEVDHNLNGDFAQDEDNEDDDLQHLHASQVRATLQREVKCHLFFT